jgi:ribonuclease P protein component
MLPLPYRLKGDKKFSEIYKKGNRFYTPFFTLFVLENPNQQLLFGFVTAKEVGIAPMRNRIRRQLSEIIRNELPKLQSHYSVVIKVLPAAASKTSGEIEADLLPVFQKAGLFQ